ncbi:hypothetical protein [Sphingobium chlorophenolicum]|nr:hypothetical protein [Sphingobium chlorophenolicum]
MTFARDLVREHRWLAFMLVACVLFARVVIPSGFMPVTTGKHIVVQICNGTGPATVTMTIPSVPAPHDAQKGKAESPCAFSGLGAPFLSGADPALLAGAIFFLIAMGLRAARPLALSSIDHLRPPLRGPPVIA